MASSALALRRLLSSTVVPRSLRTVRPAAASRLFNTNAVRNYEDEDDRNHHSNQPVSHRDGDFFSDIFNPFTLTRRLSQVLNFMDKFSESPLISATRGMGASGGRRGWDAKEKDEALHLRIDMPGLSKEDVKIALEHNILVIKGEGKTEEKAGPSLGVDMESTIVLRRDWEEVDETVVLRRDWEEVDETGDRRRFTIELPEKVYNTDEIKAEMKNGVLKVVIPKVKEEERNNVRHINVD